MGCQYMCTLKGKDVQIDSICSFFHEWPEFLKLHIWSYVKCILTIGVCYQVWLIHNQSSTFQFWTQFWYHFCTRHLRLKSESDSMQYEKFCVIQYGHLVCSRNWNQVPYTKSVHVILISIFQTALFLQWKKPWSCRTAHCSSTKDRRAALEHEPSSRRRFTMNSWREAPRERRTEKSETHLTKPASKDHRSEICPYPLVLQPKFIVY